MHAIAGLCAPPARWYGCQIQGLVLMGCCRVLVCCCCCGCCCGCLLLADAAVAPLPPPTPHPQGGRGPIPNVQRGGGPLMPGTYV